MFWHQADAGLCLLVRHLSGQPSALGWWGGTLQVGGGWCCPGAHPAYPPARRLLVAPGETGEVQTGRCETADEKGTSPRLAGVFKVPVPAG